MINPTRIKKIIRIPEMFITFKLMINLETNRHKGLFWL
jgi:hypothetical protein